MWLLSKKAVQYSHTYLLPRNFEGLLKGTKKRVGDIGEASVGFCGGGLARF
jgi:hypothetical protein